MFRHASINHYVTLLNLLHLLVVWIEILIFFFFSSPFLNTVLWKLMTPPEHPADLKERIAAVLEQPSWEKTVPSFCFFVMLLQRLSSPIMSCCIVYFCTQAPCATCCSMYLIHVRVELNLADVNGDEHVWGNRVRTISFLFPPHLKAFSSPSFHSLASLDLKYRFCKMILF